MLKRLFLQFENLSALSRRIILGGTVPALFLMLYATGLFIKPFVSYENFILSRNICKTAVTLFSEGIIFGLFIDAVLRRN